MTACNCRQLVLELLRGVCVNYIIVVTESVFYSKRFDGPLLNTFVTLVRAAS
jgi:hypothetical protein